LRDEGEAFGVVQQSENTSPPASEAEPADRCGRVSRPAVLTRTRLVSKNRRAQGGVSSMHQIRAASCPQTSSDDNAPFLFCRFRSSLPFRVPRRCAKFVAFSPKSQFRWHLISAADFLKRRAVGDGKLILRLSNDWPDCTGMVFARRKRDSFAQTMRSFQRKTFPQVEPLV
jgi:hypothetical protein